MRSQGKSHSQINCLENLPENNNEDNLSKQPDECTTANNDELESQIISKCLDEVLDKVVEMENSAEPLNTDTKSKLINKNLSVKEEVIQSDSPPSSYTRIGLEAKKFLLDNPKITRTLESKLKKSNIPVYRKLEALEKSKTPQKKGSTPIKQKERSDGNTKIPKFILDPIQDLSPARSPIPSSPRTSAEYIQQYLPSSPSPLRDKLIKICSGVPAPDKDFRPLKRNFSIEAGLAKPSDAHSH